MLLPFDCMSICLRWHKRARELIGASAAQLGRASNMHQYLDKTKKDIGI